MDKPNRIVAGSLWGILVFAMIVVIGSGVGAGRKHGLLRQTPIVMTVRTPTPSDTELPELYPAPSFSLTDENGKTVTDQSLRGKPWVAEFVFTSCAGPCPIMSQTMARMQQATNPDVHFVSFSVDPEHDTPAVLKDYGKRMGADEARWSLLTGPADKIQDVAVGMKITDQPASADAPIMHDTHYLLVDGAGKVRAVYAHDLPDLLTRVKADTDALLKEGGARDGR